MTIPLGGVDWSQVNTLLLVGATTYLWRQARTVDALKQALLGLSGKGDAGLIHEVQQVRHRTHELANVMATLNITVGHLTAQLEEVRAMQAWDGVNRRKSEG
jgi:hypothetical protein